MPHASQSNYVIHGNPRSLFTRKLQAAFDFYGLPYDLAMRGTNGGDGLSERAGTHQIPVLETPENWALADTTPILELLDGRVPGRGLFPDGAAGVLVHVVEEILDEWVARVMVHYRWHYAENTVHVLEQFTGTKMTMEEAAKHPIAQWGPRACRATGTGTPAMQRAAEAEYIALMEALEAQLGATRFALGDRPTAADCILLGGLLAHTNADPIPDLSGYKRIMAWVAEGAAMAAAKEWGAPVKFPDCTPFAEKVLQLGRDQYVPFVVANAAALEAGAKSFEIETWGETASYLTRPYPEQSRQRIKDRIQNQLIPAEREQVQAWLEQAGLGCFLP